VRRNVRAVVPGSDRGALPGAVSQTACSPDELARRVGVTIVVRPRESQAGALARMSVESASARTYVPRAAFAERFGASDEDLAAVAAFATSAGLEVGERSSARRTVEATGTLRDLAHAFGATIVCFEKEGGRYVGRTGELSVPSALVEIIVAVLGIDERPQASVRYRWAIVPAAASVAGFSPPELARAYGFPAGVDGSGQTIALIELGGGYDPVDLAAYFAALGLATPRIVAVGVDGAGNAPANDPAGPDGEVALDIEVAGAIAPGAAIVVYFAPNTDRGFLDAVTTAVHDATNKPAIVSISWGGPESTRTAQAMQSLDAAFADAALLGISVFSAAGDHGSSDNLSDGRSHVDFPSSSPYATACGGTRLAVDAAGTIASETVWNNGPDGGATGGGVSDVFAMPDYQQNAGVPPPQTPGSGGRGVPDVAADADPQTGYRIRVAGRSGVVGGTSAVAPLWAALIALANQRAVKPAGFVNPVLYANAAALRDITVGDNGAYTAGPGWDACTGLGTPVGTSVAALFGG